MKELLMMIIIVLVSTVIALGQTFSEWFRQKKTQIHYLEKQIAALEVYKQIVEKGYQVAKEGTMVINVIKQGDLDLHSDHFSALEKVNPRVLNDGSVASSMSLIGSIKEFSKKILQLTEKDKVPPGWPTLGRAISASLKAACDAEDENLLRYITDGELKMTDDERLSAIDDVEERLLRIQKLAEYSLKAIKMLLKK